MLKHAGRKERCGVGKLTSQQHRTDVFELVNDVFMLCFCGADNLLLNSDLVVTEFFGAVHLQ